MIWETWPEGTTEYFSDPTKCPVCDTTLRPVEIFYTSPVTWYEPESTSYYTAICPHCRTKYNRYAPTGTVTISPDANTITELEERTRHLEETLSHLITWVRTQQTRPQALPEKPQPKAQPEETQDEAEEFTRRYRYLL